MTLAAYNAKRKALTRLERVGWLNYRLSTLMNIAQYLSVAVNDWQLGAFMERASCLAAEVRAYRARHKFWECR